jgi:hypothetical protein
MSIYQHLWNYDKIALFVWLISHQPAVLFFQNKPAISNQPAVPFSQNKSPQVISHQPNEQTDISDKADVAYPLIPKLLMYFVFRLYYQVVEVIDGFICIFLYLKQGNVDAS